MIITFNAIDYDSDRIALIHTEGIVIKPTLDKLFDVETSAIAVTNVKGHSDYLAVAAVGDKYKALVRTDAPVTEKTKIYLLSKILLKKCQANAQYDDLLQREQRSNNMYQDRPPSRYGDRGNNFRNNDYGRPRSRGY